MATADRLPHCMQVPVIVTAPRALPVPDVASVRSERRRRARLPLPSTGGRHGRRDGRAPPIRAANGPRGCSRCSRSSLNAPGVSNCRSS